MPTMDGLEATRIVKADDARDVRVLILTTFDPDEYVYDALRAGASGFVFKDIPPRDLLTAVRVVADGEALLAPSITRRLVERFAEQLTTPQPCVELDRLTARETEVLRLLAKGLSKRRDRRQAVPEPHHDQVTRRQRPRQARLPGPRPSRRVRLRARRRPPWPDRLIHQHRYDLVAAASGR